MLAVHPEVTVGVLTASNDMWNLFDAIMNGISSAQFEFLNMQSFVFPKRVVVEVGFFIVNGFYIIKIRFWVFSFSQVETLTHTSFDEGGVFIRMAAFTCGYPHVMCRIS